MSENKVVDIILHCQKQIKKEIPEEKLLHYLGRLSRLRVSVQDLADTGIGRTVNSLSRNDGPVGQAADTLVRGWKRMVSEQQNQEAEPESEEDSDSNSGSSEEEDEEEEVNAVGNETFEIEEQEANQPEERRYNNGHGAYEDCRPSSEPPPPARNYEDGDDEDLNDDIEDPYMENGFMNIANVHSDGDDDEEEENDFRDSDSDAAERLEIVADDNDDHSEQHIDEKPPAFFVKQEKQLDDREQKSSHTIKSNNNSHKSHDNDHKKQSSSNSSSSKSHRDHSRSSEKSQSREHKQHHHRSSSKESSSKEKERSKQSSGGSGEQQASSSQHKNHQLSSSSKAEKSKESKADQDKSRHHKDKEKHHRSKESSSSYREREKEVKQERERSSKDKKDSTDSSHGKSSYSSQKNKIRDPASSSSQSPKKSSLESSIKKEKEVSSNSSHDDRKRKEHSSNSPCDSSSTKKSKLVLKEEIDSNSGINFADVLGSLDVSATSNSKHSSSGSKKDKRKEDHEKSHRKHHHESHHGSSSSKKKHTSPSSSKHSSSRDAGSSSSSSSSSTKKHDRDSETSKTFKKAIPQGKIESVIQPVVNISPNYKPLSSSSLPKIARLSAVSSSSGDGNGIAVPPPIPLSQVDLSDLASVDYWDNNGKSGSQEMSQEDAISTMLSSRNARSKVYSGVKTTRRGEVTSLFDLCMQVIKDNIGDLGYTGGIPYDILKPALERANPQQLICIESQNDYLIGETDELWQFHCKRDFRGKVPAETESWRELYERCTEERQQRFEVVKKQMKRNIEKAEPVRKAKLAFVDTTSTTRFNRHKAQTIKNGMKTLKIKEEKGPNRGVASSASAGFNNPKKSGDSNNVLVEEASVIIAPESRAGHAPAPSVSREVSAAKLKPKKAPLMQKTMKLIKSLHRR